MRVLATVNLGLWKNRYLLVQSEDMVLISQRNLSASRSPEFLVALVLGGILSDLKSPSLNPTALPSSQSTARYLPSTPKQLYDLTTRNLGEETSTKLYRCRNPNRSRVIFRIYALLHAGSWNSGTVGVECWK